MAYCVQCKKPVGCGCQLVNGLCSTCRSNKTVPQTPNTNTTPNVNQSTPNNQ